MSESENKSEQLETVLRMMQEQMALQGQMIQMMMQSGGASGANQTSQEHKDICQAGAAKMPQASRPVAHLDMTESKWKFFEAEWERYKRSTNQKDAQCQDQLLDACTDDLREDLFKSLGVSMKVKSENDLLTEIKKLAIKCQSQLVNRYALMNMTQESGEPATQFLARLRGQAALCGYEILCEGCNTTLHYEQDIVSDQLVRGLASSEIQEELLARGSELTTQEKIIEFISAKESARISHDALSETQSSALSIGALSQYQRQKRQARAKGQRDSRCHGCGSSDHGHTFQDRKAKCPVRGKRCPRCRGFGHLPEVVNCKSKEREPRDIGRGKVAPATQSALTASDNVMSADGDNRASFLSVVVGAVTTESGRVPHLVHDGVKGWVKRRPSNLPCVQVTIQLLPDVHEMVGHGLSNSVRPGLVRDCRAIADTGAQTTAAGIGLVKSLGLPVDQLIPVSQAIQTADGSPIDVMGAMCIRVRHVGMLLLTSCAT